jgi:hypothetical protein
MERLITGALAAALEAGRPRFNALFARARHEARALDAGAFADHLRARVAPAADAVAAVRPERVAAVVDVLFEFSLDLVARDLLTRTPALADGWERLLTGLPGHLAAAPRPFAGSLTNALCYLAQTPGARPAEWVEAVLRAGALAADVPALLEAGKVCAWRAGLAHFRAGALEACRGLPPSLARAALGLPPGEGPLDNVLDRLRADPWLSPAAAVGAGPPDRTVRLVRTAGGFRGFAGPFLRPPTVAYGDGHFVASDGERSWLLSADYFGATLHPTPAAPPADTPARGFSVDRKGKVTCGKEGRAFPELEGASSQAGDGTTLAVTVPLSHLVFLVARSEAP